MANRGATNHKDITGKQFGELVIVKRVGRKKYTSYITPLWECKCKEGHSDIRTGVSLRNTGENTVCKVCLKKRNGKGSWELNASTMYRAEMISL